MVYQNWQISINAPHWDISDPTDFELSGNFGALHERCPVLSTNQVQHICFFPFDPFHLRRREPLYLFVVVVLVCYDLCHFPFCESGRSEKKCVFNLRHHPEKKRLVFHWLWQWLSIIRWRFITHSSWSGNFEVIQKIGYFALRHNFASIVLPHWSFYLTFVRISLFTQSGL